MAVGHHPQRSVRGQKPCGGLQKGHTQRGVGVARGVKGWVAHHGIDAAIQLERGGIGPMKLGARVGDIAAGAAQCKGLGLDQMHLFDGGLGQDGAGQIAPASPKVDNARPEFCRIVSRQQGRACIGAIGGKHAGQRLKAAIKEGGLCGPIKHQIITGAKAEQFAMRLGHRLGYGKARAQIA